MDEKEKFNFVKFTGVQRKHNPYPVSMAVGEIVARYKCSNSQRSALRSQMRRLIKMGKEFSIHEDQDNFVIRRDK
jgi:hypothetical protein